MLGCRADGAFVAGIFEPNTEAVHGTQQVNATLPGVGEKTTR